MAISGGRFYMAVFGGRFCMGDDLFISQGSAPAADPRSSPLSSLPKLSL